VQGTIEAYWDIQGKRDEQILKKDSCAGEKVLDELSCKYSLFDRKIISAFSFNQVTHKYEVVYINGTEATIESVP